MFFLFFCTIMHQHKIDCYVFRRCMKYEMDSCLEYESGVFTLNKRGML